MKTNRKPEYHKTANLRIISMPNRLFAVQSNIMPDGFRSRTTDKWQALPGAAKLSYEAATAKMTAEAPNFGGKA